MDRVLGVASKPYGWGVSSLPLMAKTMDGKFGKIWPIIIQDVSQYFSLFLMKSGFFGWPMGGTNSKNPPNRTGTWMPNLMFAQKHFRFTAIA